MNSTSSKTEATILTMLKDGLRDGLRDTFSLRPWTKSPPAEKLNPKEKIKTGALKIAFYYMLFSPLVAMPFYNTCIFHPFVTGQYDLTQIAGVPKQDEYFKGAGGQRLHGWYFKKPGATKTVLFSHGNAGNLTHRNELTKLLINSGASVFIYDYSGFGLSQGSPNVDTCCKDAVAAYDHLNKDLKIPADLIVLFGESLGTAFSCQVGVQKPAAGVILMSAFQSLPQIAAEKVFAVKAYPAWAFPVNPLDSLSFVKGQHPPLLLIHGQRDDIIPSHNSDDLFNAASNIKELVKLPKAGHNDIAENVTDELKAALKKFLN